MKDDLTVDDLRIVRLGTGHGRGQAGGKPRRMREAESKGSTRYKDEVVGYERRVAECDTLLGKLNSVGEGK